MVSDTIFEMPEFGVKNTEQKRVVPVFTLTCSNCGNIKMFNSIKLGFSFNKKENEPQS